jgi:hypothetical protein
VRHIHGIVAEVRQTERALERSTVGVGVGAHAPRFLRRKGGDFRNQPAGVIEQCFRLIAAHPLFKQAQVLRIFAGVVDGNLVRPPKAFDFLAVDFLRAGPSFRAAKNDERPARQLALLLAAACALARVLLDLPDALDHPVEHCRHALVHFCGL